MKIKYILLTIVITVACLGLINYFTLFGLKVPHKTQVIYTWEYPDIFATAEPQYVSIVDGSNSAFHASSGGNDYCWVIGQIEDTEAYWEELLKGNYKPYTRITFRYSDGFSTTFPIWNRDLAALDRDYRYTLKLQPMYNIPDTVYYKIIELYIMPYLPN